MPNTVYRDFEVRILGQGVASSYSVLARVAADDLSGRGELTLPYSREEILRALIWMEEGDFDAQQVRQFGADLFRALFAGQIKQVYTTARQSANSPLRLRFIIEPLEVARLPWELLFDPDRQVFLALEAPLVRGISLVEPVRPLQVEPPLRVLVLEASPQGVPPLEGSLEQTGIRQQLAGLVQHHRADVTILRHTTLRSLQNALREANETLPAKPFHALHFIGHGAYDSETNQSLLLFEDDAGEIAVVTPEALVDIVRPYGLRLVFLNACQSLRSSAVDITQGFAPALLSSGVPAVIGMQVSVLDRVARQFAQDFYAALADNQPVDRALVDARQLTRGAGGQAAALGIPICYLRSASGQIMEVVQPQRVPFSPETWRSWLRERLSPGNLLRSSWWLIGALATILGLVLAIPTILKMADGLPMTGGFNIAVARVSNAAVQSSVPAGAVIDDLSTALFKAIDEQTQGLRDQKYDIQVRGPTRVSRIQGDSVTERQKSAAALASKLNADLVIYGHLIAEPDRTSYDTELYLSDRALEGADEAAGLFPFGDPIEVDGNVIHNVVANRELNERMSARAVALAQFAIGLGHFARNEYQEADQAFDQASQLLAPADTSALRVIYLFRGTTAAKLQNLPEAEGYYARSLQIDDRYARARLGLAQVHFLNGRQNCSQERTRVQELQKALSDYDKAVGLANDATSEIPTKVSLFKGNIKLCLSQAKAGNYWDDALGDFKVVVEEFENRTDSTEQHRIKYLAAEAYAGTGLIHRLRSMGSNECAAVDDLVKAEEAFGKATGLSREPGKQAVYALQLAAIHACRLECRAGEDALRQADKYYRQFQDHNPQVSDSHFEEFRRQLHSVWSQQCRSEPNAVAQPGRIP